MTSSRPEGLSAEASAWEENLYAAHRAKLQKRTQRSRPRRSRPTEAWLDEVPPDQTEQSESAFSRHLRKWFDVFGVVMLVVLIAFAYFLLSHSAGEPATWLTEQVHRFAKDPLTLPDVRGSAGDAIDWLLKQLPIWWDQLLSLIEDAARWLVNS